MHDSGQQYLFDLGRIAAFLEALEETIIYRLLDRGQFARNDAVYQSGSHHGFPGNEHFSLLEIRLRMQEEMDARFGRFLVPEERPYSSGLPEPMRTPPTAVKSFPIMDYDCVRRNEALMAAYLGLIPKLCEDGDDGHHGSSVEHDVASLQGLARRVHYGALYVAESKYRDDPHGYAALIHTQNKQGLIDRLTRPEVEERILKRVSEKMDRIQETINRNVRRTIRPEVVLALYRDHVIPLTKEGEVAYLLNRPIT